MGAGSRGLSPPANIRHPAGVRPNRGHAPRISPTDQESLAVAVGATKPRLWRIAVVDRALFRV
jgi:hypothetical protein